jgi:hypothetical protein
VTGWAIGALESDSPCIGLEGMACVSGIGLSVFLWCSWGFSRSGMALWSGSDILRRASSAGIGRSNGEPVAGGYQPPWQSSKVAASCVP